MKKGILAFSFLGLGVLGFGNAPVHAKWGHDAGCETEELAKANGCCTDYLKQRRANGTLMERQLATQQGHKGYLIVQKCVNGSWVRDDGRQSASTILKPQPIGGSVPPITSVQPITNPVLKTTPMKKIIPGTEKTKLPLPVR